ncbi:hypothetical protein JAAARDRAFT_80237 [Jaapia argillacea MUCL 33604]|uniref:Uncharacterized protein n=1 Tax=Jaapia argillacea MUCL 33604 TaxID=933084 RepID=A0A067PIJ5_9AGAM|nr:hypothetical protein JAAARDRAFT_80237 [Jaapia argillacea MUCL 33604]
MDYDRSLLSKAPQVSGSERQFHSMDYDRSLLVDAPQPSRSETQLHTTHYDRSLLTDSSQTSRSGKQDEYNVDIIDKQIQRQDSIPYQPTRRPLIVQSNPPPNGLALKESRSTPRGTSRPPTPCTRFSRRTLIILLLLAVVIIAAIVGGAVGGTKKLESSRSHKTSTTTAETSGARSVTDPFSTILPNSSSTIPVTSTTTTSSTVVPSAGCMLQIVDGSTFYGSPTTAVVTSTISGSLDFLVPTTFIVLCSVASPLNSSSASDSMYHSNGYDGVYDESLLVNAILESKGVETCGLLSNKDPQTAHSQAIKFCTMDYDRSLLANAPQANRSETQFHTMDYDRSLLVGAPQANQSDKQLHAMYHDRSLLAGGPQASRLEKQGEYDVGQDTVPYQPTHHPLTAQSHSPPNEPTLKESRSTSPGTPPSPLPRTRFSRRTPTILLLLGIVIIAAIVGGAVGGTRKLASSGSQKTNTTTVVKSGVRSVTESFGKNVPTNSSGTVPATSTIATYPTGISSPVDTWPTTSGPTFCESPTIVVFPYFATTMTAPIVITTTSLVPCSLAPQLRLVILVVETATGPYQIQTPPLLNNTEVPLLEKRVLVGEMEVVEGLMVNQSPS